MNTKLLTLENIILDVDIKEKNEVIELLASSLSKEGVVTNYQGFLEDIYTREEMDNTAVGFKVAIPHGKSKWITDARVGFLRLNEEIYWGDDEEYIKYVFLIAVPTEKSSDHIDILMKLSKKILDETFQKELGVAKTKEEVLNLINI